MPYKKKVDKLEVVEPKTEIKKEPPAQSRAGGLKVRMVVVDETHEWNFKAKDPCDAIDEGKRICKENGFRWPSDVIVWDFS